MSMQDRINISANRLFNSMGMGIVTLKRYHSLRSGSTIAETVELARAELSGATSLLMRGQSGKKLRNSLPSGLKLTLNTQDLTTSASTKTVNGEITVSVDALDSSAAVGDAVTVDKFVTSSLGQGIISGPGGMGIDEDAAGDTMSVFVKRDGIATNPEKGDTVSWVGFLGDTKVIETNVGAGHIRIDAGAAV